MMKHRTFALFLALGLSLSLLSGCGPKESGSTSQPGGSTSSSQGSPDASQPDVSLPDASAPDTSAPGESAPEAPQPPVDEPEAVAALALDKSDFSLFKAGSSYQLKATVSGVDAPKVTWTSSDETVAAVSQDGTVTAVARGTATITAAVEGTELRASCTVRCKLPEDQPVSGGGNSSSQGSGNGGSSSQAPAADQADLSAFYTQLSGDYEFPSFMQQADQELLTLFEEKKIPHITVYNKSDLLATVASLPEKQQEKNDAIYVSAKSGDQIYELKERIGALAKAASAKANETRIVADLIQPEDVVVLVVPIDSAAPKGRLILPQQQTIRDVLESGAISVVTRETELPQTLRALGKKPALVITDSQAFQKVTQIPRQMYRSPPSPSSLHATRVI